MTGPAILVAGGHGLLGTELARVASSAGVLLVRASSAELDVTDPVSVASGVRRFTEAARAGNRPAVVVNAAADTATDAAESRPDPAYRVNAEGPVNLGMACLDHGIPLIHISSDYVFDGRARVPYEPYHPPNPLNVYGKSKVAGERALLDLGAPAWIVRTSWLFSAQGGNFLTTMARLERERAEITVVDDQTGSPTWVRDLASGLLALAGRVTADDPPAGSRVLHYANAGQTTWHGLAHAVFDALGADPSRVRPCTSEEFARPARRPSYSVLSPRAWCEAGLPPPPPWRSALTAALAANGPGEVVDQERTFLSR
ncbi:dTDP-4-dehydrorhamnose reductase [Actinomadura rubteroloni]|uniref:dTDP-4-dehydrorhamnose reductase n=1 Tax=Actinomadura rubteroloni TaxID=1926885 RepID=A0A2P4UCP5_9ACTN|nr:dTDP-4-dehydrorhamnose reductase [Actinomadura rubteroloni]POM22823.1 dTDP-4-dehydrorhamnose reductase [Actinomadura rubteroloni]